MHLFLVINFRILTSYKISYSMPRNCSEEFARIVADAFHGKPDEEYLNNLAEHDFIKPLTRIHARFCCALVFISEFRCRIIYVSPRIDGKKHIKVCKEMM